MGLSCESSSEVDKICCVDYRIFLPGQCFSEHFIGFTRAAAVDMFLSQVCLSIQLAQSLKFVVFLVLQIVLM